MRDFTKYDVWNNAIDLAVKIYEITKLLPESERFGISNQMQRAKIDTCTSDLNVVTKQVKLF